MLRAHGRDRRALQRRDRLRAHCTCRTSTCPDGKTRRSRTCASWPRTGCASATAAETPELRQRLEFELKTIEEMGFPDYFLIVWDFIRFARADGVSVGPGRGSAAGSLVAYCLRITDLDPMRYSLLFERFLNPGRKSHARRRRRLRRGRPRARDQLRGREVRPPQRRPDHHLRQDAAQGGDQGRRPGDGHPLRRGRPDRQARARRPRRSRSTCA